MADIYIGLMSGTSLDGADAVLADFSNGAISVLGHASAPFPAALRAELLALNTPGGTDELHRAALAANSLARIYAQVASTLLKGTKVPAVSVVAIGAHGQTVRHRPLEFDEVGYTLQLNNPALLAELTGIDVVADFRTRDLAAGGQGAPLVPAFHRALFSHSSESVGVLNIGGISNLSLLPAGNAPDGTVLGFDCGPGNALLDHWCQSHQGQPYDAGGQWAASGQVLPELLASLLAEPFFSRQPPKSTGRDLFNPSWLAARLHGLQAPPADVQATLAELTATACASDVQRHRNDIRQLVVCGGGALNTHLMTRIAALLPGVQVLSSAERGLPPQQVEATAFAWLARAAVLRQPGNLASVTGARGERTLGALYPA